MAAGPKVLTGGLARCLCRLSRCSGSCHGLSGGSSNSTSDPRSVTATTRVTPGEVRAMTEHPRAVRPHHPFCNESPYGLGLPGQEISASVSLLERGSLEHDWHHDRRWPTAAHQRVQTVPMDRLHPAPDRLAVPDSEGEEPAVEDPAEYRGNSQERPGGQDHRQYHP